MLLDQLEKINELPVKERKALAKLVLSNNPTFARYLNLCYNDTLVARPSLKPLKVKYRPSESPVGMDFASLESVYSKFYRTVFQWDNVTSVNTTDATANTRLTQIFEILSEIEVEFLKQIIKRKYAGLTKKEYDNSK